MLCVCICICVCTSRRPTAQRQKSKDKLGVSVLALYYSCWNPNPHCQACTTERLLSDHLKVRVFAVYVSLADLKPTV